MNLILTRAQAEAVMLAASALENVGGKVTIDICTNSPSQHLRKPVRVFELHPSGAVRVVRMDSAKVYNVEACEDYASWAEFAEVYCV